MFHCVDRAILNIFKILYIKKREMSSKKIGSILARLKRMNTTEYQLEPDVIAKPGARSLAQQYLQPEEVQVPTREHARAGFELSCHSSPT